MRKLALLGASALVLALGVATVSAEPFNPATRNSNTNYGNPNLIQQHSAGGN